MKIVIFSQEDYFVIPRNIQNIVFMRDVEVPLIVALNTKGTLINKKMYFLQGFGIAQALKMGIRLLITKTANSIDHIFSWRIFGNKSVHAVAEKHHVAYKVLANPNEPQFLSSLRNIAPDLIVSFSAPCIFGTELLSIPRLGCINLHCSYLPHYAGLLPSYWVLHNNEKVTGVTVHYMNNQIDNGKILAQVRVPIKQGSTMFELIQQTKSAGGNLICQVIQSLQKGAIEVKENISRPEYYFSWPSIEQMKEFRRRGGRLI